MDLEKILALADQLKSKRELQAKIAVEVKSLESTLCQAVAGGKVSSRVAQAKKKTRFPAAGLTEGTMSSKLAQFVESRGFTTAKIAADALKLKLPSTQSILSALAREDYIRNLGANVYHVKKGAPRLPARVLAVLKKYQRTLSVRDIATYVGDKQDRNVKISLEYLCKNFGVIKTSDNRYRAERML